MTVSSSFWAPAPFDPCTRRNEAYISGVRLFELWVQESHGWRHVGYCQQVWAIPSGIAERMGKPVAMGISEHKTYWMFRSDGSYAGKI